jgi:signal transduction histidine kinase
MQKMGHYDILIAAISVTMLFVLLVCFMVVLLMINRKKKLAHIMEKQQMTADFEKQLLQSQLEIQEQSFNNISHEIHDNVGQLLSLTTMQLNILEHSDELNRPILEGARTSLNKAIIDLRDLAKGLSTDRIARFSLLEDVAEEINRIQRSRILVANLRVEGKERALNPDRTLISFRIVQECLQNILKHAGAKNVSLLFNYGETELQILIQDDGKGFDVHGSVNSSSGLGLSNIMKRTEMVGGKLIIESRINEGTRINIYIPYV